MRGVTCKIITDMIGVKMSEENNEIVIRKHLERYCNVEDIKKLGRFTDYFYDQQQMFAGLVIDRFMEQASAPREVFSISLRMRRLCGYYICDAAITEELFKRKFKVIVRANTLVAYFKFKDPRRLDKRIEKGEFDYFTNECLKLFETEDDFKYLKYYARPGFDVSDGLDLDQPAESCNL